MKLSVITKPTMIVISMIFICGCATQEFDGEWIGKAATDNPGISTAVGFLPEVKMTIAGDYFVMDGKRENLVSKTIDYVDGEKKLVIETVSKKISMLVIDDSILRIPATPSIYIVFTRASKT